MNLLDRFRMWKARYQLWLDRWMMDGPVGRLIFRVFDTLADRFGEDRVVRWGYRMTQLCSPQEADRLRAKYPERFERLGL